MKANIGWFLLTVLACGCFFTAKAEGLKEGMKPSATTPRVVIEAEAPLNEYAVWTIGLGGEEKDLDQIWIDLNDNGVFDKGEKAKIDKEEPRSFEYKKTTDRITIYGAINKLAINFSQVTKIDLSQNSDIEDLDCYKNFIGELDLSNCSKLKKLECQDNKLAKIILPKSSDFSILRCSSNGLTSLDLSYFTQLEELQCDRNVLTQLILPASSQLKKLVCYENILSGKVMTDLMNALPQRESADEALLQVYNSLPENGQKDNNICLVSDVNVAKAKGWKVYDFKAYENKGLNTYAGVQASNQDVECITIERSDNSGDWRLMISSDVKEDIKTLWVDINGNGVRDTGEDVTLFNRVEDFSNKEKKITIYGKVGFLDCSNIKVTSVDVSKAKSLKTLQAWGNDLTNIDVSQNPKLICLSVHHNPRLEKVNVLNNPKLNTIAVGNTKVSSLDLSKATRLQALLISDANFSSLDLSVCKNMTLLDAPNNKIASLKLPKEGTLVEVNLMNNKLRSFSTKGHTRLMKLNISFNNLEDGKVDISASPQLIALQVGGNHKMTSLDLSKQKYLTELECGNLGMKTVDVSRQEFLNFLDCAGSGFTSLDISRNKKLSFLSTFNSQLGEAANNKIAEDLAAKDFTGENAKDPLAWMAINTKSKEEKNVVSTFAVEVAENKGWLVFDYKGGVNGGRNPYAGTDTAVKSVNRGRVSLYPTYAQSQIEIDLEQAQGITIISERGEVVKQDFLAAGHTKINISSFAEGWYFAKIGEQVYSFFVKR